MSSWHKVCKLSELSEGKTLPVTVDDYDIVLVKQGDNVFALEDNCSHQDFPLSHGAITGGNIKCKAHGAEFCLETGKAMRAPAFAPVRVFDVKIEHDEVLINTE